MPSAAATSQSSAPDAAQLATALSVLRNEAQDQGLELRQVNVTSSGGMIQDLYVGLDAGDKPGDTPVALASTWQVLFTSPGATTWNVTITPPVSVTSLSAAAVAQDASPQSTSVVSEGMNISSTGGASDQTSSTVTEEILTPASATSTNSDVASSQTAGSAVSANLPGEYCVTQQDYPQLNYLFGLGVAVGQDQADCSFPATYTDDITLWQYPYGPAAEHSANGLLTPIIYGYYQTNETSVFCANAFPSGWWVNEFFSASFIVGGYVSSPPGGSNGEADTLSCAE